MMCALIQLMQVTVLKKYEAERKPANIMMMGILDGFQKAYSVDFGPLNILRAAALHGAHFYHLLKEALFLMHQGNRNCHYSLEKHSKLFLPEDINGLDFCTSCSNE